MSTELKEILEKTLEKKIKMKEISLEQRLPHFKDLILKIREADKLDLSELVEGSAVEDSKDIEKDLELLEECGLVVGEEKFSKRRRIEYREYTLTNNGTELAEKLERESKH